MSKSELCPSTRSWVRAHFIFSLLLSNSITLVPPTGQTEYFMPTKYIFIKAATWWWSVCIVNGWGSLTWLYMTSLFMSKSLHGSVDLTWATFWMTCSVFSSLWKSVTKQNMKQRSITASLINLPSAIYRKKFHCCVGSSAERTHLKWYSAPKCADKFLFITHLLLSCWVI